MTNKYFSLFKIVFVSFILSFSSHCFSQSSLWCLQDGGTHPCIISPSYWAANTQNSYDSNRFPTFYDVALYGANWAIQNPIPGHSYSTILWSPNTDIDPSGQFYTHSWSMGVGEVAVYGMPGPNNTKYDIGGTKVYYPTLYSVFCPNGWKDASEQVAIDPNNPSEGSYWTGRCTPGAGNYQLLNYGFAGISGKDSNVACQSCTNHPVNIASGGQQKYMVDTQNKTPFPIVWARYYNSAASGWSFTYSQSLQYFVVNNTANVVMSREDGSTIQYVAPITNTNISYNWSTQFSVANQKILAQFTDTKDANGNITGFNYINTLDQVESYDSTGKLISITDRNGNIQTMNYDSNNCLIQINDSWGNKLVLTAIDALNKVQNKFLFGSFTNSPFILEQQMNNAYDYGS